MTRPTFCLGVLLVALALAPTADAAVVDVRHEYPYMNPPITWVQFTAVAGEANHLRVAREARALRLIDDGAEVTAGAGCTQVASNEVTCPLFGLRISVDDMDDAVSSGWWASIDAGDGNDRVEASGGEVLGGAGADVLEGSAEPEHLSAGPGADIVSGLGGDDTLGGSADGELDTFDGGQGHDRLSYGSRGPVSLNLSSATAIGGPGESDTVRSIEDAAASGESVRLLGSDGDNELQVFSSSDFLGPVRHNVIVGGGGDDDIDAENDYDRDTVRAGKGNDVIGLTAEAAYEGLPDGVVDDPHCGPGRDRVEDPNLATLVPEDCEAIGYASLYGPEYRLRLPVRSLRAEVMSAWSESCEDYSCRRFKVTLRRADPNGRPVGPVLARDVGSGTPRLSLRLNRHGRRVLGRRREFRVAARVFNDPDGESRGFLTKLRYAPR